MRFTKMHGAGNDYVYVSLFDEPLDGVDRAALARAVSDRHGGIGSDGLILIAPSDDADARMEMYNADGSRAEMCGNGIRCVAKYVWDHDISRRNPLTIATDAGLKRLELTVADDKVRTVAVDMGEPALGSAAIGMALDPPVDRVIDRPIDTPHGKHRLTAVSMGNPHVVIYTDDVSRIPLAHCGAAIETHALFPQRTNVHFVQVSSPGDVTVVHWERGSGATLACGTGTAAVCVAGVLTGRSERRVIVRTPGGRLDLDWSEADNHVTLIGPADEVFTGEWPMP
jgi:diaminopimelate epimerase